jgi:uncharacterized Zn finger protein
MLNGLDGLLKCSACDFDLELLGKQGAVLKTKCHNCGATHADLDLDERAEPSQGVQVYYRKAPSNPG